jgi:type IV pilus assembly protein PilM
VAVASEVAQAVSVAAAYFEDTLETAPEFVLTAGTLGAEALAGLLEEAGVKMGPVPVREMAGRDVVDREMLAAGAASTGLPGGIPPGWLAGVRGALKN